MSSSCRLKSTPSYPPHPAHTPMNSATGSVPRCSPVRRRKFTVPSAASRSPMTSMYGIFCNWALRILAFMRSALSSTSTRSPAARSCSATAVTGLDVAVGDGDDHDLHRAEPDRERAAVVLDEHAEEALHAAQQRPVDHVRPVLLPILADVFQVERSGSLKSNWIVLSCHSRSSASSIFRSIFGP